MPVLKGKNNRFTVESTLYYGNAPRVTDGNISTIHSVLEREIHQIDHGSEVSRHKPDPDRISNTVIGVRRVDRYGARRPKVPELVDTNFDYDFWAISTLEDSCPDDLGRYSPNRSTKSVGRMGCYAYDLRSCPESARTIATDQMKGNVTCRTCGVTQHSHNS